MKTHKYEDYVQVVDFPQGHVRVKLITEAGEEIGGAPICIEIPVERVPIHMRKHGERFRLRRTAIYPEDDDNEEAIRSALDSEFEVSE